MRKPGQSIAKARDKSEYISGYSCQGSVDERFRWPGAGHNPKAIEQVISDRVDEMARRYAAGMENFWVEERFDV